MNECQWIIVLDAVVLILHVWIFRGMKQGRKLLRDDYQPGPTTSEAYAADSDWRR